MAINSKAKGARGERELCTFLRETYGLHAERTQQYCGNSSDSSDIRSDLDCHIEVKRVDRLNLAQAFDQARQDSINSGKTPVVCHKKDRGEWMISMALADLGTFVKKNKHLFT